MDISPYRALIHWFTSHNESNQREILHYFDALSRIITSNYCYFVVLDMSFVFAVIILFVRISFCIQYVVQLHTEYRNTTKRKTPQRISESVDLIPATPPLLYSQLTVADGFAKAYFRLYAANRAKVKLDENMPCRETTVTALYTR